MVLDKTIVGTLKVKSRAKTTTGQVNFVTQKVKEWINDLEIGHDIESNEEILCYLDNVRREKEFVVANYSASIAIKKRS